MPAYIFGPFRLDTEAAILLHRDEPVSIGLRAVGLLRVLVERHHAPVSKDTLIGIAWAGLAVEESNLPVQIAALRRVLGRAPGGERWIETLPRRGYRFVGPVAAPAESAVPGMVPGIAPGIAPGIVPGIAPGIAPGIVPGIAPGIAPGIVPGVVAPPDKPSLAVLPFANMSGDAEQEYFADGIVEEIITALSHIRWLFVVARNSSFAYKGRNIDVKRVGRELGVRYVLEGSVRRSGERVRIAAQLIDAGSGAHLWADGFEGSLADVFELQDRVAASVAGAIEPTLEAAEIRGSAERPTTDLTAYDLYLRALGHHHSFEKDRLVQALALLGRAIERDPRYGAALALAAHCHARLDFNGWADNLEANRRAGLELARQALQAADDDPEILARGAYLIGYFGEDIDAAIGLMDRALAARPGFAQGWLYSAFLRLFAGQPDMAIEQFERCRRLSPQDPLEPRCLSGIGCAHFFNRRFDDAARLLRMSIEGLPGYAPTYRFLAASYAHLGRLDEARTVVARLRRITGEVEAHAGRRYRKAEHRELLRSGLRLAAGADRPTEAAALPAEAGLRQLTAMSCNLVGMPARSDGSGLEDWRETVADFQRCLAATAACHQGLVHQDLGTSALVLFGYPAAHEHDAERAVRAGLELCAAVRTLRSGVEAPPCCRVGIATGMVIVEDPAGAEPGRGQGIAGEAPDLAARLATSAHPDTVTVEPATKRLIGDLFDCRELGAIEIAYGTEPIRSWQVLGDGIVEGRFEALHGPALTPLVGRGDEIDLLLRRWARAMTGDGQIVLVCGEPGIGKSRLAAALAERLHAEPHLRLRYFCSPHHQDSALFPFIDQLGRAAGFTRDDPPAARLEKLEAVLARAAPPEEDVALLADLLSLPVSERQKLPSLGPQRRKERLFAALLRQLERLAERQPVLAVFEDAQWADPTSRELLDLAVERVRNIGVLLIVTFRPELQPPWTGQPQVTTLALNRLDRRERTALIADIAGKALPDDVVAQITDHTDGVPLFVEELTRSVLESGLLREEQDRWVLDRALPPFAIPTTLHASLLARLDRLASIRHLAQTGAAIGRQFSYGLLRAASRLPEDELQAALGRLVASELVLQRGTPPDAVYSFKHALVQDAAHGSLLREPRRQLHAQIAAALETHFSELTDSQPEIFARHYAEAGLVEKAVAYWGKAGRRSAARSAMAEAAAQLQKGLDQLSLLPDAPKRQRAELEFWSDLAAVRRAVKGHAAPETGQAYVRAIELWERLGFPAEFVQIPYGKAYYHAFRGEFDQAQGLAEALLSFRSRRDDPVGLFLGHFSSGQTLMLTGRFSSSRSHLEAALALYDRASRGTLAHQTGIDPLGMTRTYLATVLFCLGCPERAATLLGMAVAETRRLAHPPSLAGCITNGLVLLMLTGANRTIEDWTDELAPIAAEHGVPFWQAAVSYERGWIKVNNGDVGEGLSLLRNGLAAFRATGAQAWLPFLLGFVAKACKIAGQIEESLVVLDEALQIATRTGERWFAAELYRCKGDLPRRQGDAEAAGTLHRKALSIAQEQEAKLWELRAAVSLARLRREQGRPGEARDLLAPVCGWFTEGFATPDLKEAKALLDALG